MIVSGPVGPWYSDWPECWRSRPAWPHTCTNCEGEGDGVTDAVREIEPVQLGDCVVVGDIVCEAVVEVDVEADTVTVGLELDVTEAVVETVGVDEGVTEEEAVGEATACSLKSSEPKTRAPSPANAAEDLMAPPAL